MISDFQSGRHGILFLEVSGCQRLSVLVWERSLFSLENKEFMNFSVR